MNPIADTHRGRHPSLRRMQPAPGPASRTAARPAPRSMVRSLALSMALSIALLTVPFAVLQPARAQEAPAQDIDFHPPVNLRDAQTPAVMRDLAQRVLPVYQEKNTERYLGYLSALQLVAGEYAAADATRASLARRRSGPAAVSPGRAAALYDIYVHARAVEARDRVSLEAAFTQAYRETLGHFSDLEAYAVTGLPPGAVVPLEAALQAGFDAHRGRSRVALADAVELVWTYFSLDAWRRLGTLPEVLGAEDERRRYQVDDKVVIRTPDGARLHALVVRPRGATPQRPALLEFTIDPAGRNFARESAAHGYVGVMAYARGVGGSSGAVVPFEHDGADAEAVIGWIAHQSWSDGRVAMYGDGYSGYSAWAAARRAPPALKAIATTNAMAPGISFPMVGNIFQNTAFAWLAQVVRAGAPEKTADAWQALYRSGYTNGDPSGDLDGLLGQPNPTLHRWLDHPEYDGYWQAMIPYREQFAQVDIPVLSISGYYAAGQIGTHYYFREHTQFNAKADHTLLLGPYGDNAGQQSALVEPQRPALLGSRQDSVFGSPQGPGPQAAAAPGTPRIVAADSPGAAQAAFPADPGAAIALGDLRYQWFDFVLRGGARPALLQDRVNYAVAGADTWRHAPTPAAMGDARLRLYLDHDGGGATHRLAENPGPENAYVHQTLDLADRHDADVPPTAVNARNAVVFASQPLSQPAEVGGVIAAHLDLLINKRDVDLTMAFYERLANGEMVALFDPLFAVRASNAVDRSHRHLLTAGVRQSLDIGSDRLTSRLLHAGSQLVLVLGVNKRPDQEINLGTGRNVREEYIEYAGPPLDIRWYGDSYIELPVRR